MSAASKYLWVGMTSARSNLAYFGEVVARTAFLGVIMFIFLQLWKTTFAESGTDRLGGLTLPQMLWYLGITESIVLSAPRVSAEVDQDVRTGALAVQLLRPLSYPLYRMWTTLGERAVRFAMNAFVASAISLVFVGPISITPLGLGCLLLALPLAFALDFLAYFLIGLGAFWLENTNGLTIIYSRLTMILGGMLLPLELFPDALRRAAAFLPFASVVYGPAHMFVAPDAVALGWLLARQAAGILVVGACVGLVYRAATRRVFSNGG